MAPSLDPVRHTGTRGLPAYVVLDTSASMTPYQELLNETIQEIYDTLMSSPQLEEFIHLAIITFNTSPHLVLGMTGIGSLTSLPNVTCGGLTNYQPMFDLIRDRVNVDLPDLSSIGVHVLRPVVFLLTDGAPTDKPAGAWTESLDRLRDPQWRFHPHILTYGFGESSETVLRRISTIAAYVAESGTSNRRALVVALSSLLSSLVSSAEKRQLQVPEEVAGYRSVPLDFVDF
jgi:uncharacterized protein YegL